MERLNRLIDPETGEVELILRPYHLERLHGLWEGSESEETKALELPFPLHEEEPPFVITLRGGMTLDEVKKLAPIHCRGSYGKSSWWGWLAYGFAPLGWPLFPTAHFSKDRLKGVVFEIHEPVTGVHARFQAILAFARSELGPPDRSFKEGFWWSRRVTSPERADRFEWRRSWGTVAANFEPRDSEPQIAVWWRFESGQSLLR